MKAVIAIVALVLVGLIMWVCFADEIAATFTTEPNEPVWGKGDAPTEWQDYFGDDNMARLNYIQTQQINKQGQSLAELKERVRKLEDATQSRKIPKDNKQ